MLDPDWVLTRPILWLALLGLVALLVVRAIRRDRLEYRRFKRFRSTARRQAMYRKWLRDAFVTFGSLTIALVLLAGAFIAPLLAETSRWPPIRAARDWVTANPVLTVVIAAAVLVGFTALTVAGVIAARKEGEVPTIGDIRAMLPRNRPELGLGAVLSVNAGAFEELVFRLGIPALLFGASGSALTAVAGSVLLFGALHAYQGVAGVIGTTLIGAVFMASYLLTGSILVPIVLHTLFDLRSLVFIPMAISGAHRVRPTVTPATRTS
jgi:membrane protease YdiL (CAAX protease family)